MKNKIIIGIIVVIALVVVWYLASPLFIDKEVDEPSPIEDSQIVEETEGAENVEGSEIIYQGSFVDADSFHKVSGQALVIEENGKRYLRFENFDSTNGPDLKVYIADDLNAGNYISLGDLKGNKGDQNYELNDIDLEDKYVLIWCEAFSVLFGSAEIN